VTVDVTRFGDALLGQLLDQLTAAIGRLLRDGPVIASPAAARR
jgi:hypothetical protein